MNQSNTHAPWRTDPDRELTITYGQLERFAHSVYGWGWQDAERDAGLDRPAVEHATHS